jgi:hypothetical protein
MRVKDDIRTVTHIASKYGLNAEAVVQGIEESSRVEVRPFQMNLVLR